MINFEAKVSGKQLDLLMYGVIGSTWFEDGITDKMIADALAAAPNVQVIRIQMNSGGGDAFMGMAIANLLQRHPARKEMDVDGLCASAATAIAMRCDEIRMNTGSQMMIHEASGRVMGKASEMRSTAEALENVNRDLARMYAARSGKSESDMRALMTAETWLAADRAVALKLADKVTAAPVTAKGRATASASIGRFAYRNVPDDMKIAAHARSGPQPTHNGLAFADMGSHELIALKHSNPTLYRQMADAARAAVAGSSFRAVVLPSDPREPTTNVLGSKEDAAAYARMTGSERAALKKRDPNAHAKIRLAWIADGARNDWPEDGAA